MTRSRTIFALPLVLTSLALGAALIPPAAADSTKSSASAKTERWYEFRFHGKKVGFMSALDEPTQVEGQAAIHSLRRSLITVRRQDHVIRIEATTDVWSAPNGAPIRFKQVRDEGGAQRVVQGFRDGQTLQVKVDVGGTLTEHKIPLGPDVFLSTSLDVVFKKDMKVGKVLKGRAVVEDDGQLRDFSMRVTGTTKHGDEDAFVVESDVGGIESKEVVLADGRTIRSEVPRLGAEFLEVSREKALQLEQTEDIFSAARLLTGAQLPKGDEIDELVVRLSGKSGRPPKPVIDARQKTGAKGAKGSIELKIRTDAPPKGNVPLPIKGAKTARYLVETPYEPIKDERVVSAAKAAVGGAKDAWTAAKNINGFVHQHIRDKTLAKAFSTAVEALESREGDCTEHAVLFSALAKVVGIPTRLVTGLVYVGGKEGVFGYHEWVEVWMGDRWIAMDPTFGQDIADPTHVKFTEGLSDGDGLRDAGIAAAELFGDVTLQVVEYTKADGTKTRI